MVEPHRIPRPEHNLSRDLIDDHVLKVLYRLKNHDYEAYVVGGAVRDILRGRNPKDFDIATDATPGELKDLFRNSRVVGRRFKLVHVVFGSDMVEVATLRRAVNGDHEGVGGDDEDADADLYIADDNLWGDVESDAFRRDFTINALFYDIRDFSIIDYVGGVEDIQRRLVRAIGDPWTRFQEDPVRMLRAIKFAARFEFTIEPETDAAIRELPEEILKASRFRVIEEIFRIITQKHRHRGLEMLADYGLLAILFPSWLEAIGDEGFDQVKLFLERIDQEADEGRFLPLELVAAGLFIPLLGTVDVHHDRYQVVAADLTATVRQLCIEMDLPKRLASAVVTLLRGQLYLLFQVTRQRSVKRFVRSPEFDWVWRLHDLAFGEVEALHGIQEVWLAAREELPEMIDGWAPGPDSRDIFSFRGKTGGGRRGEGEPVSVLGADGESSGGGRPRRRRRGRRRRGPKPG